MAQKALLDTNIFLHILFEQDHQQECLQLLHLIRDSMIEGLVTNFSLFSIALLAYRKRMTVEQVENFLFILQAMPSLFVREVSIPDLVTAYRLSDQTKSLDLEDAIQYTLAKKENIPLVTYDQDFIGTDLQVITPEKFFV
jgi:predicted nucleic acid-binding protein